MGAAQVWRLNAAGTAWLARGRPPRPRPPFGTTRADLVTRVRVASVYAPPASFTIGTTKPDESNTGASGTLTRYPATGEGNLVVTTAGAVIENRDVYGHVIVRAANVTVRNCRVRGFATEAASTYQGGVLYGLVDANGVSNCLVEQCTLIPAMPAYFKYGAQGTSLTVRRCNISRVVDGVNFAVASGTIVGEGNYIHDFSFFADSPNHANDSVHPGWTHNDGFQISGGSGHIIRGNTIFASASPDVGDPDVLRSSGFADLAYGSGITISPDKSAITGLLVELNWIDDGNVGFQANYFYGGASSGTLGTIQNNRFGMGQHDNGSGSRYQIRYKNGYTIAGLTTNVWDTVPSVPLSKQGTNFAVGFTGGIRVDN